VSPGFFEAQIHGGLAWSDLDTIVIRYSEGRRNAAGHDGGRILACARRYDSAAVRVELSRIGDPVTGLPVPNGPVQACQVLVAGPASRGTDRRTATAIPQGRETKNPNTPVSTTGRSQSPTRTPRAPHRYRCRWRSMGLIDRKCHVLRWQPRSRTEPFLRRGSPARAVDPLTPATKPPVTVTGDQPVAPLDERGGMPSC
jgi:hypothetical protein